MSGERFVRFGKNSRLEIRVSIQSPPHRNTVHHGAVGIKSCTFNIRALKGVEVVVFQKAGRSVSEFHGHSRIVLLMIDLGD